MRRIFGESHWLYRFLSRAADWMLLSVLWCICSLPVITIGVSTTALYFVMLQLVRGEEPPIIKTYFRSCRVNLKQGLGLGVLVLLAVAVTIGDYYVYRMADGFVRSLFAGFCMLSAGILLLILPYLFPLLAQFDNTVWQMIKNSFVLSIANLPITVFLLLIHAVPVVMLLISWELVVRMLMILLILAPAAISYFCSKKINRIFEPLITPPEISEAERMEPNN